MVGRDIRAANLSREDQMALGQSDMMSLRHAKVQPRPGAWCGAMVSSPQESSRASGVLAGGGGGSGDGQSGGICGNRDRVCCFVLCGS